MGMTASFITNCGVRRKGAFLTNEVTMVNTVSENEKEWSPRQVARAKKARRLHQNIGTPSICDCKAVVQANMIKNCPVTMEDIKIAEQICSPAVNVLKGKTTRKKPAPVVNDCIEVPKSLWMKHQGVELCADLMFVQGVIFLVTVSKHIKFVTVRCIPSKTIEELCKKAFDDTFRVHNHCDFRIDVVHADQEFKKIENELLLNDIELNEANAQEHVPEIERTIRTEKERIRCQVHRMPFAGQMPILMHKKLVQFVTRWLNCFPPKGGVSQTHSPRAIVTGRGIDHKKHCLIPFGSHVEATTENNPTNSMSERTISGIYLGPKDVQQRGHMIMNLNTGRLIERGIKAVKEIPMTKAVIARVRELGACDGMKPVLQFKCRKNGKFVIEDDALIAGVDEQLNAEDQVMFTDDEEEEE